MPTKGNGEKEKEEEKPEVKMEEIDPDGGPSTSNGQVTTQAIEDMRKICPELAKEMEEELKNDVAIEDEVCKKCKKDPTRFVQIAARFFLHWGQNKCKNNPCTQSRLFDV